MAKFLLRKISFEQGVANDVPAIGPQIQQMLVDFPLTWKKLNTLRWKKTVLNPKACDLGVFFCSDKRAAQARVKATGLLGRIGEGRGQANSLSYR